MMYAPPCSEETGTRKPEKLIAGMTVPTAVMKMAATCERVKQETSRPVAVVVAHISRVPVRSAAAEPLSGTPNQ